LLPEDGLPRISLALFNPRGFTMSSREGGGWPIIFSAGPFCPLLNSQHTTPCSLPQCFLHTAQTLCGVSALFQVCLHYNKGSGPHGCCTFQGACTKMHLCQHFVQGDCIFGKKCKRQHAIDEHGLSVLEERGLSRDAIHDLPFIYGNIHQLRAAAAGETEASDTLTHACLQVHFYLPYKWEVLDGSTWTDLQHMEDIERDFCDPYKTERSELTGAVFFSGCVQPIDFMTMTRGSQPVRRLSTVSSVKKPPFYSLTTDWLWYYKGDHGKWVEYGQLVSWTAFSCSSGHAVEGHGQVWELILKG
uniref:Poly (ADP-ribose) polymerase family, member 12b n=1 Tax=Amphilophus citrinellus TaxID=61819 RepID=A0A3Q0RB22_AMPCI